MPELNSVPAARCLATVGHWSDGPLQTQVLATFFSKFWVIDSWKSENVKLEKNLWHNDLIVRNYTYTKLKIHIDVSLPLYPYQSLILPKILGKINLTEAGALWLQLFFSIYFGRLFLVTDPMRILGILVTRNVRHGDQASVPDIFNVVNVSIIPFLLGWLVSQNYCVFIYYI